MRLTHCMWHDSFKSPRVSSRHRALGHMCLVILDVALTPFKWLISYMTWRLHKPTGIPASPCAAGRDSFQMEQWLSLKWLNFICVMPHSRAHGYPCVAVHHGTWPVSHLASRILHGTWLIWDWLIAYVFWLIQEHMGNPSSPGTVGHDSLHTRHHVFYMGHESYEIDSFQMWYDRSKTHGYPA